jgi:ribosome modulation factor
MEEEKHWLERRREVLAGWRKRSTDCRVEEEKQWLGGGREAMTGWRKRSTDRINGETYWSNYGQDRKWKTANEKNTRGGVG